MLVRKKFDFMVKVKSNFHRTFIMIFGLFSYGYFWIKLTKIFILRNLGV